MTRKEFEAVLPAASVALQTTMFVPDGNVCRRAGNTQRWRRASCRSRELHNSRWRNTGRDHCRRWCSCAGDRRRLGVDENHVEGAGGRIAGGIAGDTGDGVRAIAKTGSGGGTQLSVAPGWLSEYNTTKVTTATFVPRAAGRMRSEGQAIVGSSASVDRDSEAAMRGVAV